MISLMRLAICPIREAAPPEMAMRKTASEWPTAMSLPDLTAGAFFIMSGSIAVEEVVSLLLDEDGRLGYCQWV